MTGAARQLAVIAGSGLGGIAQPFETEEIVAFSRIEGVGECTVPGHAGEVRWCRHQGTRVAIVLGRRHFYEGGALAMRALIDWLAAAGTTDVLSLSAAGALTAGLDPGDLVLARGIIDLQDRPFEPPGAHPAFPGRSGARVDVDGPLGEAVEGAAKRSGIFLRRGTIVCGPGPTYETRAEVRALRRIGADLATMSAAPEVSSAHRAGLRVAVVAAITNHATGIHDARPGHDEVVAVAGRMAGTAGRMVSELISL